MSPAAKSAAGQAGPSSRSIAAAASDASPTGANSSAASGASPSDASSSAAASSSSAAPADPLRMAQPRIIPSARRVDPAAEKRELTERLLNRSGGARFKEMSATPPRLESHDDEDDGAMSRLAQCLGNLERSAALQPPRGCGVSDEGRHELQQRLDGSPSRYLGAAAASGGSTGFFGAGSLPSIPSMTSVPPAKPDPPAKPAEPRAVPLPSEDAPAASTPSSPPGAKAFALSVQLADGQVSVLGFDKGDDLLQIVTDFRTCHRLRDLFEGPLLSHAELMLCMGRKEDRLDIIDLV
eukprot:gnl/TRDRNA2_/TRDRNA2_162767_c3_seq2.p1 gnl/TRDRNA2_/TRDRNA2_162767_c3~~gnl/TRDRNA2_/TRDRNA2_162767_c3_seq2.p1  ORF type:complete len:303 (+),score=53.21 gnl/TRDRNA2_/TRDRNA2_162767_c3_seq2:26-910(+)